MVNPVLWQAALAVSVINLPFGFWRAGVPRFSRAWFLAVHLPVPAVVALRLMCRLGWQPVTFAVLVGAFFAGQFSGGLVRACARRAGMSDGVGP